MRLEARALEVRFATREPGADRVSVAEVHAHSTENPRDRVRVYTTAEAPVEERFLVTGRALRYRAAAGGVIEVEGGQGVSPRLERPLAGGGAAEEWLQAERLALSLRTMELTLADGVEAHLRVPTSGVARGEDSSVPFALPGGRERPTKVQFQAQRVLVLLDDRPAAGTQGGRAKDTQRLLEALVAVEATGGVRYRDDTGRDVVADRLDYDRLEREVVLRGNPIRTKDESAVLKRLVIRLAP